MSQSFLDQEPDPCPGGPSTSDILPNSTYQRCADLWFEDGAVVLEAENTLFRVFPGILSRHSSVFGEMFSFPQPDGAEAYEGCPLVHIPDSSDDMTYFLKAIHDITFYRIETIEDINVIAGVLRLSTKYDVPFLRQESIRALTPIYPRTLLEWDRKWSDITPLKFVDGMHFTVVELARRCDVPALLPAALYSCCKLDSSHILDGVLDPRSHKHLELEWDDKRLCMKARRILEHRSRKKTHRFLYDPSLPSPPCETPPRCAELRHKRIGYFEDFYAARDFWDPLRPFSETSWKTYEKSFCGTCLKVWRESMEEGRNGVWDELPQIFQLGTWEDLTNVDME